MTRPYWLGAGVIFLGIVWIYQALQLPIQAQYAQIGPGFFLLLVGGGLIVFGAALLVQIWRGVTFEAQDAEDVDEGAKPSRKALALAMLAAAMPVITMVHFGFVVTAALTFFVMTLAFGSRRYLLNLAISLSVAVICYYGFRLLGVQLGGLMPILGA